MVSSCCPEKKKCRSGKQVTGEREPRAINWEYGQRLGQGLVLPIFGLFNMHLANSLISDAGSVMLQFEREPSQAAFELHQDLHCLLTWVSVLQERKHSVPGRQMHHHHSALLDKKGPKQF